MKLDQKDFQILKLLQEDANITNKEIALATDLTITPVYERIKKLTSSGIIKNKIYVLDRKKLGLDLMVLISVSLNQHLKDSVKHFMSEIIKNKEVVECYHLTGSFDFHLKVYVKDMNDYQDFILNKLSAINNIGHMESYFVMKEIKNTTCLPIV